MRRTDRLFDLIQVLRDGRLHKAQDLAERMEVSVRTIYRDMDSLVASGIPVEGERGVGYLLRAPVFLPPMSFTQIELEALHLGAALVRQTSDPELQQAAARVLGKVDAAMPEPEAAPDSGVSVYASPEIEAGFAHMPVIRSAIRGREVLALKYRRLDGVGSTRHVWPLQLEYWGRVWTMCAWCELREDFRVFRVDRIEATLPTGRFYEDIPGRTLRDYLAQYD